MSILFGKSQRKTAKRQGGALQEQKTRETAYENEVEGTNIRRTLDEGSISQTEHFIAKSPWSSFEELGLAVPLVQTCRSLGFQRPSPVQRTIIPFLIRDDKSHVLALAATGSGKTAAFVLPILHRLAADPYGIYCIILSPTRELAKQIHQQILALGSAYKVQSALVVGGLDSVRQSCELDHRPHFVVATPGRLAELLRGPNPPQIRQVRYLVLDEADRLLAANSGFERDVAELLLHCNREKGTKTQTLMFSATMTRSLESVEEIAGAGNGRLPLQKFVIKEFEDHDTNDTRSKKRKIEVDHAEFNQDAEGEDDEVYGEANLVHDSSTPRIPAGLRQEYIFMPSRVRDAYLLTAIRTLMSDGGRSKQPGGKQRFKAGKRDEESGEEEDQKARSAIVFVSTCERAALVSGILSQVGVENVALHSLLSQNRRLAALGKFKSHQARVLVATSLASRGLDIPSVDLVLNAELPRSPVDYVHRVGRTARAGRRGRAISLVGETDVSLVHAVERMSGRPLEKCTDVTDEAAIRMLGPVTKAARLAKMRLMDIGFDELVKKFKERKVREKKHRERIERSMTIKAARGGGQADKVVKPASF